RRYTFSFANASSPALCEPCGTPVRSVSLEFLYGQHRIIRFRFSHEGYVVVTGE
uniref:Uncharacterized protein n=1 Tax=Anopheles atroparvus TaxID=41427 RepID=A0AAG5D8T2_ANOAO